jgi:putative membrane protein
LSDNDIEKPLPAPLSIGSGFLMGAADAIPGVSGGTIALILGIYERLIESIHQVLRAPLALRNKSELAKLIAALRFLVPLGGGVVVAYFLATKLLVGKTENPGLMLKAESAPIVYGFFFGLVLVSLREPWRRIKGVTATHLIAAVLGCAAAAILAGLPHTTAEPAKWMLVLGGAGAISVMLLPGVSGSLLLVVLGQYTVIAGAVHDRNFGILLVFMLGIALGVITFVPALRVLLHRWHDLTMAGLTGLMAGSLRALWPWKDGYDPKAAQMQNTGIGDHLLWVALAAIAGAAVVFLLARLEALILRAGEDS